MVQLEFSSRKQHYLMQRKSKKMAPPLCLAHHTEVTVLLIQAIYLHQVEYATSVIIWLDSHTSIPGAKLNPD